MGKNGPTKAELQAELDALRASRGTATATTGEKVEPYPERGAEALSTEHSHRHISNGDGTAREVPIVNAAGQFPPRPQPEKK